MRELKHRVSICSAKDVVVNASEMTIKRDAAFDAWAKIEAKAGAQFSVSGFAIQQDRNARTHKIYIKYRRDVEIGSAAWIYEPRLSSSPRWFKIIKVTDMHECGETWCFDCRLVERGDQVETPQSVDAPITNHSPLPAGVKL